jgi:hypothetical protein
MLIPKVLNIKNKNIRISTEKYKKSYINFVKKYAKK